MKNKIPRLAKLLSNPDRDQFQFTTGFQLELLKFLVQDKSAITVLKQIKSSYFTLLEHSLTSEAILKAFKKYHKIPGEVVVQEILKNMLNSSEYVNLATKDDLINVNELIHLIYTEPIQDSDIIKTQLKQFIAYIELRDLSSNTDFTNFQAIRDYHRQVAKIIRNTEGSETKQQPIHYMVEDVVNRQLQRKIDPDVIPTPFRQINELTNAGGYEKGSIIVLLDKAKAKKTFTMLNIARGYLAMKKNVLYIDTENGATQIMGRMVQSTLNKTKLNMLSGDYDDMERRHMRKYARLKSEFAVKKVSALVDDCNTIRGIIRDIETERQIKIHVIVCDYVGKLASIARDKDDFERIGNAYIDLQNLAHDEGIEAIWSAHHITREGSKHIETRYSENDVSGSIAIIRNAEAVWGLNQTNEERDNNIQRMEVVVQRDGKPQGRALFNLDIEKQRMKEFTKEQRKSYDQTQGLIVDEMIERENGGGSKRIGKKAPNVDADKASKKSGDI